jgi:threonyl-tRNA synthetase
MPISDKFNDYAKKVQAQLLASGFRVDTDLRSEKIGYKIREAQMQKVPFMLVVGEKEAESGAVSVRIRGKGDVGSMEVKDLVDIISQKINSRENDSPGVE